MLTIREQQMEGLRASAIKEFESRLAGHLRRWFPAECTSLDLPSHVARAVERARSYGFQSEHDLCLYLHLTLMFGPEFDTDPAYSWTGVLQLSGAPAKKMKRLYAAAVDSVRAQEETASA